MAFHVREHSLAYCLIDNEFRVKDLGGSLSAYGLDDLRQGHIVEDRFSFLEKIPLGVPEALFFPRVFIVSGRHANIHIIMSQEGLWIILLDATAEVEQLQLMQQRGNEAGLLGEEIVELRQQMEAASKTIEQLRAQLVQKNGTSKH